MHATRPARASRRVGGALAVVAATLLALPGIAGAQGIAIHGRVEDGASRPLAGATVRLYPVLGAARASELHLAGAYPPPPAVETRSGADGAFRLEAPRAGHWRIAVSAPEKAERQTALAPLLEETWLAPAVLPDEAPLEVRVVGADRRPVAGALVGAWLGEQLRWRPGAWEAPQALLRTDAAGRAVVSRAVGERLHVAAAGTGLTVAEVKEVAGPTVTLTLRPGSRRAVAVTAPGGGPAAGVLVLSEAQRLPLGRTGPGGRLIVATLPGEDLGLVLEAADGAAARLTVAPLRDGEEATPAPVRLLAARRISGRVVDRETRQPLPGVLVWLPGGEDDAVLTDARGGYVIERGASTRPILPLSAAAAGYFTGHAQLPPGAAAAPTIALDPAGSLLGSVVDGRGRPVADVEITAAPVRERMGIPRPPRFGRPPRGRSDGRGRFRLAPLDPRSRHELTFRREGYAPLRRAVSVPLDRPGQVDVVLAAGAVAGGVVVDARGEPVGGAAVSLRRQEEPGDRMGFRVSMGDEIEERPAEATSDRAGRFAVADLAPGRYELTASATGFAAATLPGVEVPVGAATVDLGEVELASGVSVTGRVVDGRGQPVAGAEVFALSGEDAAMPMLRFLLPGREPSAITAADGAFAIPDRRPGERVDVAARRSGFTAASAAGVVAPNEEPVVVTLREASDVRGRVVDGRGEPVADARVMLSFERGGGGMMFSGSGGIAVTGGDGRFALEEVEPGAVRLTVQADGYLELVRGGVEVPAGRDLEGLELVVRAGAVVEGVVTTPDGSPAIGARVGVLDEEQPGGLMRLWFAGAEADGEGRYRLSGVEPGRRTLAAQMEGFERGVAELEVASGENRLDLRLGAGQEVSGRVTGPRGEPVAGAAVRVSPPGEGWWSRHAATTDEGGGFSVPGVPDGTYEVTASHPEHAEGKVELSVAGGPVSGLLIELASSGAVAGALRGLEAAELAETQVHAQGDASWREGQVERDGRYRVSGLGPGTWRVIARVAASGRQARGSVELAPGQAEATLDLDFTGGFTLQGVVRHEERPVDGAMVMARGTGVAGGGNTRTDYQGRYRLENLPAGAYTLEVADLQRGLRHRDDVALEGDREHDVDLRSARVAGRVLEATSDEPVAGARLELEALDEEPGRFRLRGDAESDDRGAFFIAAVGEGRWRLKAQKPGYAPAELTLEVAGEPVQGLELRLQPTQGVTLLVGRTLGSPPEQVYAAVVDGAGGVVTWGVYPTGEAGAVRLSTVPAGAWEVLVRADGTAVARVAAASPGPPVPVALAPQATLEVVVPELLEEEVLATLRMQGPDGRPHLFYGWANDVRGEQPMARGRTVLQALPAGAWTVEVTAPDGRRWRGAATTAAGAATRVELR